MSRQVARLGRLTVLGALIAISSFFMAYAIRPIIIAPDPGCELTVSSLSPAAATTPAKSTVSFSLTLTADQGTWSDFSVEVTIKPTQEGFTATTSGLPTKLAANQSAQVSVTLEVGSGVVPQTYTIHVLVGAKCHGRGGQEEVTGELTVPKPPPPPTRFNGVPEFNVPIEPELNAYVNRFDHDKHVGGIGIADSGCERPIYLEGQTVCGITVHNKLQDIGSNTVYIHSGEFFHHQVDLEILGRGFNWKFERKYRSGVIFDGPLGHNWEFNYNRRLVEVTAQNLTQVQKTFSNAKAGNVARMDGNSRADLYVRNSDGSFTAPTGFYTKLIKNADATFIEWDYRGTQVLYTQVDAAGIARMTTLTDRNGNTMRFQYNDKGQLTRVLDTLNRPIDYVYNSDGRLIEVKDFINRSIKLTYDVNGDLVEVTSPVVTGTPNGNDFPNGETTRYAYSSGFTDERLNHNMLTITAPNEVAAGGPPRAIIKYDTDPTSSNVDRVLGQTNGGTNSSGIPAGGTILFEYKMLAPAQPEDFNSAVSQTTVIDRNGNLTEFQFNQLGNVVRKREFTNRHIRDGDPEFYETRIEYNKDGEVLRWIKPEGNIAVSTFDSSNPDRLQQGNVLTQTVIPDSKRGGDQSSITTTRTYEPIYNQIRTVTEARGTDASYQPPNGGTNSPARYTTTYIYDYQEGNNFASLAQKLGLSESQVRDLLKGIPMNLGDLNGDGVTNQIDGNLIRVEHPTVNLLPDSKEATVEGSTRQPIVELYAYNQFGQLIRKVDPEGNVTVYDYYPENDPDGDGKDLTAGLSTGPYGYLKEVGRDVERNPLRDSKTDPEPANIRTHYFYDRMGNIIKTQDGRGIATTYFINQLNQIVQVVRAADVSEALRNPKEPNWAACRDQELIECRAGMVAFGYKTNVFYDFNGNVIKREMENRDSNNQNLVGTLVTSTLTYDILDDLIEQTSEASVNPPEIPVTKYRYDYNQNLVLQMSPVANLPAGDPELQPSNVKSYVFDERDLVFTSTRGGLTDQFRQLEANADIPELNTILNSHDISTTKARYDGNRNLIESIDAADNTGDGKPESTFYLYDGFDRRVSLIDAIGNQSFTQYDPASRVVRTSNFGPLGVPSPTSSSAANFQQPLKLEDFKQPLLSQSEFRYDELGREFEKDNLLFDYRKAGVNYMRAPVLQDGPLGGANDGRVTTRHEYDRDSRETFVIQDDLDTHQIIYDGANRRIREVDPEGNSLEFTYDDDTNLTRSISIEITPTGQSPALQETFMTLFVYDALNRRIRTTDNLGRTLRYEYDSRDNLIRRSDAENSDLITDPLGVFPATGQDSRGQTEINLNGNTVQFLYDGLNRKITEIADLRNGGSGQNPIDTSNPANADGQVTLQTQWDANSRMVAQIDDNGNTTRYLYDDLNRLKREAFADNTSNTYFYDADNNQIQKVDENGSVIKSIQDGINRVIRREVTPSQANGVIGTTLQEFEYDGLSRPTRFFDNNDPANPADDSIVTVAYDSLNRPLEEVQDGQAVSSRFDGVGKRLAVIYPNGRQVDLRFDKLDRVEGIRDDGATSDLATYDYIGPRRVLERTYQNGVRLTYLDDSRTEDIGYNGVERVVEMRDLRADGSLVAGFDYEYNREDLKLSEQQLHSTQLETYTDDSLYRIVGFSQVQGPDVGTGERFQMDGAGNWTRVQPFELTIAGEVQQPPLVNQPNAMNEYEKFAGVAQRQDDNGNLIDDGTNRYEYDFANRLRRVTREADDAVIAVYTYDAYAMHLPGMVAPESRRISRAVMNSGGLNEQVRYYYLGINDIEERRDDSTQQYVYDGIDQPIVLTRDENNNGKPDETFFYHEDNKHNIIALTDPQGNVDERVTYDLYGKPSFQDAANKALRLSQSRIGNPFLFAGRQYDPETGFYYFRARYHDPTTGRFLQRDPLGSQWNNRYRQLDNLYTYTANNPINYLDPFGLRMCEREPCDMGRGGDDTGGGEGTCGPDKDFEDYCSTSGNEVWSHSWGSEAQGYQVKARCTESQMAFSAPCTLAMTGCYACAVDASVSKDVEIVWPISVKAEGKGCIECEGCIDGDNISFTGCSGCVQVSAGVWIDASYSGYGFQAGCNIFLKFCANGDKQTIELGINCCAKLDIGIYSDCACGTLSWKDEFTGGGGIPGGGTTDPCFAKCKSIVDPVAQNQCMSNCRATTLSSGGYVLSSQ